MDLHRHIVLHAKFESPAEQMVAELFHAATAEAAPDRIQRLKSLIRRATERRDVEAGPVGDDRLDSFEALVGQSAGDVFVIAPLELRPADIGLQEVGDQWLDTKDRNHLD